MKRCREGDQSVIYGSSFINCSDEDAASSKKKRKFDESCDLSITPVKKSIDDLMEDIDMINFEPKESVIFQKTKNIASYSGDAIWLRHVQSVEYFIIIKIKIRFETSIFHHFVEHYVQGRFL